MKNQNGFSSKEFLMVIVVLAILCILAIPPFFALQSSRRRSDMENKVRTLQEKITSVPQTTPRLASLDTNPIQSPCLTCFETIEQESTNNPLWFKFSDTVYLYSTNGNHERVTDYQEPGDFKLQFDPEKLSLTLEEIRIVP
jgi:type II secretory pathway pseudopilin PulG